VCVDNDLIKFENSDTEVVAPVVRRYASPPVSQPSNLPEPPIDNCCGKEFSDELTSCFLSE
jgi:hypothetical protein